MGESGKKIEKSPSLLHHRGHGKGQNLVKKTLTRRSVLEQGPDLEKTVKKGPAVGPVGIARKDPDPKIEAQKTADQKDLDHVKAKKVVENTDPDLEIITTEAAAEDLDLDLDPTTDIQERDLDHEIDQEIVTRKPTEKSRKGIQILRNPQAQTHLLHPDLEEFPREFLGFPDSRIPGFPDPRIPGENQHR